MIRLNRIAAYFTGKTYQPGSYLINIDTDFPGLPAKALGVRLEVILRTVGTEITLRAAHGGVILKDAAGAYAGQIRPGDVYCAADIFIAKITGPPLNGARGLRFEVTGEPVVFDTIGIVGWF